MQQQAGSKAEANAIQVKIELQHIAHACAAPEHVDPHRRATIRAQLSMIARYWPEHPNKILPPL